MQSLTKATLTLDEFLSSPLANENYEFFDGELTQKNVTKTLSFSCYSEIIKTFR
ncbi:Protein of unknown function DUF820 [Crocosphaera watsonii WH 0402]|uniref:Uncharacterized protein n=1 Tax=Crocosphaera watsonii WH 0402 TaxID=1284629 RepID=T2JWK7_CROWT|nr:Protein of unknown function DUF820 [Crocosphaera watsonii WH 0402]